jgi:hypothetical protein
MSDSEMQLYRDEEQAIGKKNGGKIFTCLDNSVEVGFSVILADTVMSLIQAIDREAASFTDLHVIANGVKPLAHKTVKRSGSASHVTVTK